MQFLVGAAELFQGRLMLLGQRLQFIGRTNECVLQLRDGILSQWHCP